MWKVCIKRNSYSSLWTSQVDTDAQAMDSSIQDIMPDTYHYDGYIVAYTCVMPAVQLIDSTCSVHYAVRQEIFMAEDFCRYMYVHDCTVYY